MEEMYAQHTDFAMDLQEFRVQSEMNKEQIKALILKR